MRSQPLRKCLHSFSQQQMDGCSNFVFPEDLRQQPFDSYIATTSCGPFQTLFSSARVGEVVLFGKYLKYVIRPKDPPKPVSCEVEKTPDAFQLLMNVQSIQVLAKVTEHTSKDRMKNRLIQVLKEKELGWSADCAKTTGVKFVELMTDVLWYVDGHGKTLESTSLHLALS